MSAGVWAITVLGAFSIIGGIIGFVKARSRASLIAGGFSGLLLLLCAHVLYRHQGPESAARLASLLVAFSLGARFFMTWQRTRRLMPDLLMMLLSAATLGAVGWEMLGR